MLLLLLRTFFIYYYYYPITNILLLLNNVIIMQKSQPYHRQEMTFFFCEPFQNGFSHQRFIPEILNNFDISGTLVSMFLLFVCFSFSVDLNTKKLRDNRLVNRFYSRYVRPRETLTGDTPVSVFYR